jgi:L,D-transpeptidase ErfK/SrfK
MTDRPGPAASRIRPAAVLLAALVLAALALPVRTAIGESASALLTGDVFDYTVQPGDFLFRIGARFGADAYAIARDNRLASPSRLFPGQVLRIDNRHIVPESLDEGILINLPQRMLFYFEDGDVVLSFPVGLGKPSWKTPTGAFKIIQKRENPIWNVPKSIQEEMEREGEIVREKVPPGPDNPLGRHWLGLSIGGYGIHGTIAPDSVYQFQSHGCIRLHPEDVQELFDRVETGSPGKIVYEPVLLAEDAQGRVLLEVHKDVYRKGGNPLQTVLALAAARGIERRVDWERVREVVRRKEGLARDVTGAPDQEINRMTR